MLTLVGPDLDCCMNSGNSKLILLDMMLWLNHKEYVKPKVVDGSNRVGYLLCCGEILGIGLFLMDKITNYDNMLGFHVN